MLRRSTDSGAQLRARLQDMPASRSPGRVPAPLAYCAGELAGVGLDLAVDLSSRPERSEVVFIGCRGSLEERARLLGRAIDCQPWRGIVPEGGLAEGQLLVDDRPCPARVAPGQADVANSRWMLDNLDRAWRGIEGGDYAALVTGPIDKSVVSRSGIDFSGHTEYLAQLDGGSSVMLLAADKIKVALLTTHLPLADVASTVIDKINSGAFGRLVETVVDGLHRLYGIERPRLGICGLNPHAGESGQMGREEIESLGPAIEALRTQLADRADLLGPLAADTAFTPPMLAKVDAHLAMYHDQGLAAIKSLAFGRIVNTTLGLRFVRTSVDHGVAYDRAGSGQANADSLMLAIAEARRLSTSLARQ